MTPTEYLKRPYGRVVVPESDGTFRAEIVEFPGCLAVGDTASEALAKLEDVATSWLESVIARGLRVPEPMENTEFSGKLVLRLPRSLHKKAVYAAARERVSLNQFIVSSIAEQVGMRSSAGAYHTLAVGYSLLNVAVPVGAGISRLTNAPRYELTVSHREVAGAGRFVVKPSSDNQAFGILLESALERAHAGS